ncbi:hypothetical protein [Neobacillus cucumis]|uniref:hypothetical protein n=1 Tax=Neobacillus cucumis TaxID=1740721 RepID=UPI00285368AE|nr:hypothetical protein [Neobacillus cucumis]MDR4948110.1 hypothetical protein [Neobacillus cucumis]
MLSHVETIEKLASEFVPEREAFMELYQKVNVQPLLATGSPYTVSELKDFKEHGKI